MCINLLPGRCACTEICYLAAAQCACAEICYLAAAHMHKCVTWLLRIRKNMLPGCCARINVFHIYCACPECVTWLLRMRRNMLPGCWGMMRIPLYLGAAGSSDPTVRTQLPLSLPLLQKKQNSWNNENSAAV